MSGRARTALPLAWLALAGLLVTPAPAGPPLRAPMTDLEIVVDTLWDGTPARADEAVSVRLRDGGAEHLLLLIDAPFHGDPPPEGPPGAFWRLWNHEVVELFVLGMAEHYLEVEVGPHGHHIVLQLEGARNPIATHLPLAVEAHIEGDRWTATAWIPRSYLPIGADRMNVTAIHGTGAERRYLSWRALPGEAPDFHRIEHFATVALP